MAFLNNSVCAYVNINVRQLFHFDPGQPFSSHARQHGSVRMLLLLNLAVFFILHAAIPALAQAPTRLSTGDALNKPVVMSVQQVSPTAWYVEGLSALGSSANQNFISNAGFVVTPAGVVVIDALGSPALAERLISEIRKITPLPVTHVIVTHYHADPVVSQRSSEESELIGLEIRV